MAARMAASLEDSEIVEKTVKRLVLSMDLLTVAEFEKDYKTAAACFDIACWQIIEFVRRSRPEQRPLDVNMWRRIARDSKSNEAVYVDRKAREVFLNCYLNLRTEHEGGRKRRDAIGPKSKKIIPLLGCMIDTAIREREKVILTEFEGEIKKVNSKCDWTGLREPIVTREVPRVVAENVAISDKEKNHSKSVSLVKDLFEESEKLLSAATLEHHTSDSGSLSVYKEIYEKWIDSLFDFHHTKKGNGKLDILLMPTENYNATRDILKSFNIFEEFELEKPKGSYSEVKCSDYLVTKCLRWRMAQGLHAVRQRVKWDFDRKDVVKLSITMMQIFCLLCAEANRFSSFQKVVEGFQKSEDKLGYIKDLRPEQKAMLHTFNVISLRLFRLPYRAVVDCFDEDFSSEEERTNREEEKRKRLVKEKDGTFVCVLNDHFVADFVSEDLHARLEEEVKKLSCESFQKQPVKMDRECEKEFLELMDKVTEDLDHRVVLSREIYKGDFKEDIEEGVRDVLEHYLKPDEEA